MPDSKSFSIWFSWILRWLLPSNSWSLETNKFRWRRNLDFECLSNVLDFQSKKILTSIRESILVRIEAKIWIEAFSFIHLTGRKLDGNPFWILDLQKTIKLTSCTTNTAVVQTFYDSPFRTPWQIFNFRYNLSFRKALGDNHKVNLKQRI